MSHGPDLAALLSALDEHDVSFIVGGSVAALAHGAPVAQPGDLDVIPATDTANLSRLAGGRPASGPRVPTASS